jgi:hypothetical protein
MDFFKISINNVSCVLRSINCYIKTSVIIITSNQSDFTFGDSAINQLVNISNNFGRALDSGKEIRVVFCDISKAFDRVWFMNNTNRRGPNIELWGNSRIYSLPLGI